MHRWSLDSRTHSRYLFVRIEFIVFVYDFYHFLNSLDKYPRFNKIVNHHIESHWQTWSTCDYFIECELVLRSMSSRYHIAQHHRYHVSVNLTEEILLSETYILLEFKLIKTNISFTRLDRQIIVLVPTIPSWADLRASLHLRQKYVISISFWQHMNSDSYIFWITFSVYSMLFGFLSQYKFKKWKN